MGGLIKLVQFFSLSFLHSLFSFLHSLFFLFSYSFLAILTRYFLRKIWTNIYISISIYIYLLKLKTTLSWFFCHSIIVHFSSINFFHFFSIFLSLFLHSQSTVYLPDYHPTISLHDEKKLTTPFIQHKRDANVCHSSFLIWQIRDSSSQFFHLFLSFSQIGAKMKRMKE